MRRIKLDQIDLRIIQSLQSNGRMTNVELSKHAGISAPPCLRRVRMLEKAGFITGYHAEIDSTMLNYKEVFFALVGLNSQAQSVLLEFESHMAKWAEVQEYAMSLAAPNQPYPLEAEYTIEIFLINFFNVTLSYLLNLLYNFE